MSAPMSLWFGADAENGDDTPVAAYERIARWHEDDDLGPWTVTEYGAAEPRSHMPEADTVADWATEDPDDEFAVGAEDLLDRIVEWCSENGMVDEWWCEQAADASVLDEAAALIASPTEANAEVLLDAMASHIRYRMAGDHLGDHTLTRDFDGVVWLDGERLCTWSVPAPSCCRFHDGKTAEVACRYCGRSDCPHADACVNTCAPTS